MAKSTPSTARTHVRLRPSSPCRAGKCFVSPRTSRTGSVTVRLRFRVAFQEPAPGDAAVTEVEVPRLLRRAAGNCLGAARVEGASRGQGSQVGWLPRNRIQGLLAAELRHRAEQGPRVRMLGGIDELAYW